MHKPASPATPVVAPPDQIQRDHALQPGRSVLVQAPAGSGKTDLLTRRFLRLLAQVDEPGQIAAITFTIAAAAEMRHRILAELEKAAQADTDWQLAGESSMAALAGRALERSNLLGWKLLDLPNQLRISTIDSFCRELALQQPLLSGLGGGLDIAAQPNDLYRRAARHTLGEIGNPGSAISAAIESLLVWRDNNWQDLETQLVEMLSNRDRWMHDFVLSPDPDWANLRARLERPFANAVRDALTEVGQLLDHAPGAREEALSLARFACSNPGGESHQALAELAKFPAAPFLTTEDLEHAQHALVSLASLLLTNAGTLRRAVNTRLGFPNDRKPEKTRMVSLNLRLGAIPNLESALAAVRALPPVRYTDEDWNIIRACFTLLRHAAAQLRVAFAESGTVDFIEVAQIADSLLKSEDGFPTDAALALADGLRHLLVDEFQDTSRRQHQLLAGLVAAWSDVADDARTCFLVGDPMQSIYLFREADPELFPRVRAIGLEIPHAEPLRFDFVPLSSNFRSAPALVQTLNSVFTQIFAADDGSGVTFSPAEPARTATNHAEPVNCFNLHLNFSAQGTRKKPSQPNFPMVEDPSVAHQTGQILDLIRSRQPAMDAARAAGARYRIAILARARSALAPIAKALREAGIPMRAVELETLASRPEILDALALARALLNAHDRVAWLGVLRAPWCGLTLEELHLLTAADRPELVSRAIPDLLRERLNLLAMPGRKAPARVLDALEAPDHSAAEPTTSAGTWLRQAWVSLGGDDCYDPTARANLDQLWACLDSLPNGRLDILGPALDSALDKLTALPDPDASTDVGVQLMTIHKSKGLEFEVVIVPDLQAKAGAGHPVLLSWLERGRPTKADFGMVKAGFNEDVTEFLIAPLQPKGDDRGKSKSWVDQVHRRREVQESRRILYVAATRAREELHLFARPKYKADAAGDLVLVEPAISLLATAWPALEAQVRARFDRWKSTLSTGSAAAEPMPQSAVQPDTKVDGEIESLAASATPHLLLIHTPPSAVPTMLRRLPADYELARADRSSAAASADDLWPGPTPPVSGITAAPLYSRHEGGLVSRAFGIAVHSFFERMAELRRTLDWESARSSLSSFESRISVQARAVGLDRAKADAVAAEALQLTLNASNDPTGAWILSPHAEAATEARWSGVAGNEVHTVRVDRIFRAGLEPHTEGREPSNDAWWIIDYKAQPKTPGGNAAEQLLKLRALYAPQLEAYGRILRNLRGAETPMRAGIYYPRMLLFDWWKL